ncbi:MAG: hypothetical protein OWV35_04300 [Firmicutes bacterium]|nr:hypothetical protein [Bacillota bacterium]
MLEVLQRRFGRIPEDLVRQVLGLAEPDVIDRLILVAANAPSLDRFRRELEAGPQTFRLPGLG